MNSSYVRTFITIDEQLQLGLLPQSLSLELLADCQPSSEHRGRYNLPCTNEEVAIQILDESQATWCIIQPHAIDFHGASLQVVLQRKGIVAGTRSTMCCCLRVASTAFTWTS